MILAIDGQVLHLNLRKQDGVPHEQKCCVCGYEGGTDPWHSWSGGPAWVAARWRGHRCCDVLLLPNPLTKI